MSALGQNRPKSSVVRYCPKADISRTLNDQNRGLSQCRFEPLPCVLDLGVGMRRREFITHSAGAARARRQGDRMNGGVSAIGT